MAKYKILLDGDRPILEVDADEFHPEEVPDVPRWVFTKGDEIQLVTLASVTMAIVKIEGES